MTITEFEKKWANVSMEEMDENQLREFKNDCFAMYENGGFLEKFDSPYDEQGEHNGMTFKVLSRATEKDFDLESMPIWHIEFQNGDKAYCYPEEICKLGKTEQTEISISGKVGEEQKTKCESIYLTVRVDIEFPAEMDETDAKSDAVAEFDYEFKLPERLGMKVISTEICDVNDDI